MATDAADSPRSNATAAGILFLTATSATVVSQIILDPILAEPNVAATAAAQPMQVRLAVLLEFVNALASAGIAIALYPVLRRAAHGIAIGYVAIRAIEAAMGLLAGIGLLLLLDFQGGLAAAVPDREGVALALHDWAFLAVLMVFSLSTLLLYPLLLRTRLVPVWLSLWGLAGGLMLMGSCLMIFLGLTEIGSSIDMALSLPIAINELVLGLWLIFRGVNLAAMTQ